MLQLICLWSPPPSLLRHQYFQEPPQQHQQPTIFLRAIICILEHLQGSFFSPHHL
ncbi:hypothetical protein D4764_0287260, partial [Takifugu flavidus]